MKEKFHHQLLIVFITLTGSTVTWSPSTAASGKMNHAEISASSTGLIPAQGFAGARCYRRIA
jgi:hypothetical protein